jgi:Flp pilus assembly pilin Flp
MKISFARFLSDETGSIHIEYSMIALLIGVGLIAAIGSLQGSMNITFGNIATAMTSTETTGTVP